METRPVLLASVVLLAAMSVPAAHAQALLTQPTHLGVAGQPEWDTYAGRTPSGESLTLTFEARANTSEHTLLIRQEDVKQGWSVVYIVVSCLLRIRPAARIAAISPWMTGLPS